MSEQNDALIETPFGAIAIVTQGGKLAIELLAEPPASDIQIIKQSPDPAVMEVCRQIVAYLHEPTASFSYPLTQQGTSFQQRVWQAIAAIPPGQVRTYSELARAIGSGPRAVANACGANTLPLLVPCHRVVAQRGLGGFMQGARNGLLIKRWLLRHEGIEFPGLHGE